MSQIDIIEAKKALATRLRIWGIEVDVEKKADGFIEDLVGRGWVMNPQREARPRPPKREDQCQRCGGVKGDCACTREHLAAAYDDDLTADLPPVADVNPRLAERLKALTKEGV